MKTVLPTLLDWSDPEPVTTTRGPGILRTAKPTDHFHKMLEDELTAAALKKMGVYLIRGTVRWYSSAPKETVEETKRRLETSYADDLPDLKPLPIAPGFTAYPYQAIGAHEILKRKIILLADEMGLGKSLQTILATNADETIKECLIVCPASMKETWHREFWKFSTRLNLEVHVLQGTKAKEMRYVIDRFKRQPKGLRVTIINYDVVPAWEHALKFPAWDMAVLDEVHMIKNYQAKRSIILCGGSISDLTAKDRRAIDARLRELEEDHRLAMMANNRERIDEIAAEVAKLRKQLNAKRRTDGLDARYKVGLTGTPIKNRAAELIPPLTWLGVAGKKGTPFGEPWRFINRYCNGDAQGKITTNEEELRRLLRETVMIRRLKRDVLKEFPKKYRRLIEIPCADSGFLEAEKSAHLAEEKKITPLKIAVDLARMAKSDQAYQRAVGDLKEGRKVSIEKISRVRYETAMKKLPFAAEHLESFDAHPVVVFAHHRDLIAQLKAKLEGKGLAVGQIIGGQPMPQRQAAMDASEAGKLDVLLCSTRAAGVGLTLIRGHHVVFLEYDWTAADMIQAEDRVYRIGQTRDVEVQVLVLAGSYDAQMASTVVRKAQLMDTILDQRETLVEASENLTDDELEDLYIERRKKRLAKKTFQRDQLARLSDGITRLRSYYHKLLGKPPGPQTAVTQENAREAERICWKYRNYLGNNFCFWLDGNPPR